MAVSNVSREMIELTAGRNVRRNEADLRFHVLPMSLLILALVIVAGMAFFRSDFWLLGATFIAGGFLVVSTLLYTASKSTPAIQNGTNKRANVKHLGTGTLSTVGGTAALLAVMGDVGVSLGSYGVLVAQLGFALVIAGGFWLVLTMRDIA